MKNLFPALLALGHVFKQYPVLWVVIALDLLDTAITVAAVLPILK